MTTNIEILNERLIRAEILCDDLRSYRKLSSPECYDGYRTEMQPGEIEAMRSLPTGYDFAYAERAFSLLSAIVSLPE